MVLLINGYASASAVPGNELQNVARVTSYLASDLTTTVSTVKNPAAVLYVADPSGVILYPNISPGAVTNCVASFSLSTSAARRNVIQFAQGTSQAIYFDYLLPPGATYAGPATSVFTLREESNALIYTSSAIAPRSWPSTLTRPALAVSMPATRLSSVLLPEPLGPTIATNSPASTSSVTSCRAVTAAAPSP